jgi:hypothetical protein
MIATFQVDLDNTSEVAELKELLERRLLQLQNQASSNMDNTGTIETNSTDSNEKDKFWILRQFVAHASDYQIEVLKWMKEHPGPVSAHILKQDLPFLAPQGALSGVFRPGRWKHLSGGTKEGFPFLQIDWNREKGCGVYRGLTPEEAQAIDL